MGSESITTCGGVEALAAMVSRFRADLRACVAQIAEDGCNRELIDAAQTVETAVRAAEQAAVEIVSAVDRRGVYLDDGHRDPKAWERATVHCSPADAARRWRLGRFGRMCPSVSDALADGTIGVAQASKIAAVWSNPRVRHQLEDTVAVWLTLAQQAPFREFEQHLDEWVRFTDQDGGHRDREQCHASRDARLLPVGEQWVLRGQFAGLQGELLAQVFQAFIDGEYRHDADDAKARLGRDTVTATDLARTPAQRRADALAKLFDAAATAGLDGHPIKVTVDIVIDQATFEQQLLDLFDPLHLHRQPKAETCGFDDDYVPDLEQATENPPARRCRTVRGTPVTPADAVIAALSGHVRRVVHGADGVIIDLGQRRCLYTGSSREAAFLQAALDGHTRCLWPGCDRAPRQIDHTLARSVGGPTCPGNSSGICSHHNLIKNRGYRTRRDPTGHWHTYRPDGSEITTA